MISESKGWKIILNVTEIYVNVIHHFHVPHNTLCLSPKICTTFVFHFPWVLQSFQEKLKTILMQNFGRQTRCIMGDVEMANWRTFSSELFVFLESNGTEVGPMFRGKRGRIFLCFTRRIIGRVLVSTLIYTTLPNDWRS